MAIDPLQYHHIRTSRQKMDYPPSYGVYGYQYSAPVPTVCADYSMYGPPLTGIQVFTLGNKNQNDQGNDTDSESSDNEYVPQHGIKLNPFAPECNVPLPFHLGDEYGYYGPTAVWKRNERERMRVRCVNEGYEKLKNHLPLQESDKRLSKVDTLRLAIRYIHHLERLLVDENHWQNCHCYDEPSSEENNQPEKKNDKREKRAKIDKN